jgi:hypothetical protein
MATLRQQFDLPTAAAAVWDALADFGALHQRLVPGFVTACTLEEGGAVRAITFFNGMQAKERLVTRDDAAMRLVYTVEGGRASHYNAAAQVVPLPAGGCRFEWTVDLLPDALAPAIGQMMAAGAEAMKKALA